MAMPPPVPPPPSAYPQPSAPVQPRTRPGVLTAAGVILLVIGVVDVLGAAAAMREHSGPVGVSIFQFALGSLQLIAGIQVLADRRAGALAGTIGAALQLLNSLLVAIFAPVEGIIMIGASAFVLWALTKNDAWFRLLQAVGGFDPWTQQPRTQQPIRQSAMPSRPLPKFGSKSWHKTAIVLLVLVGGLLLALVVTAIVAHP
jgi:hypothetical protein